LSVAVHYPDILYPLTRPLRLHHSCPLPPVVMKFSAINVVSREGYLKKAAFHWAGRSNGVDGRTNAGIPVFLKHSEVLNSRVWCVNPWGDASRKRSWRFLPAPVPLVKCSWDAFADIRIRKMQRGLADKAGRYYSFIYLQA